MGLAADMDMFNRKHIFSGMKSHFVVHALKAIATIILWFVYRAYSPSDMHFEPMWIGKMQRTWKGGWNSKYYTIHREETHQTIFSSVLLLYKNQYNEANISTQTACNTQFRSDTLSHSHSHPNIFTPSSSLSRCGMEPKNSETYFKVECSDAFWPIACFSVLVVHALFFVSKTHQCNEHSRAISIDNFWNETFLSEIFHHQWQRGQIKKKVATNSKHHTATEKWTESQTKTKTQKKRTGFIHKLFHKILYRTWHIKQKKIRP